RAGLLRRTGFLLAGLSVAFLILFAIVLFTDSYNSLNQAPATLYFVIVGLYACLFLLSALVSSLNWIQPLILLAITPIPLLTHASSMFSLGCFITAEILLARLGFFKTARIPKYIITILYFYFCEIYIGISAGLNGLQIASPIIFMTIYLVFLLLVYGDKWKVYLIVPKPSLSLSALRISPMQTEYLRALLAGRSIKEIAIDGKVKESTVRNTFARVYKKFEVQDKASLMTKCEKYRLTD
ncbi:MAG: LuxR C-terminal-related transcriptional regulator, partial [Spirochaetes bacterium]|nr:LuxR C-terminal-related transcriptional regulator [Spirochaetota bacterium]